MSPPTITGATRLVAILGHPVTHSLSPPMQNAAFAAAGLDFAFVACEVDHADVEAAVHGLRALHFAGANVTAPHKQAVMLHMNELSGRAQRIGAVNTIVHHDEQLLGDNTDAFGLRNGIENDLGMDLHGAKCVVLGAGGAARAALVGLVDAGAAALTIANRTIEHATALKDEMAVPLGNCPCNVVPLGEDDAMRDILASVDLVVNCTSVGMTDGATPVDPALLGDRTAVYDTNYSHETALVRGARARGLNATTGAGMLVYQGAEAFRLWTGMDAPVDVMRQALDAALADRR